jgi:hypothetical protein
MTKGTRQPGEDGLFEPNPERYLRMKQPHETHAAASEAMDKFYEAIESAREQFRIANVLVVIQVPYLAATGEEVEGMASSFLGDARLAEALAAYGYGQEAANRQEMMAKLMKHAGASFVRRSR